MKKLFGLLIILFATGVVYGQAKNDTTVIKETALNYIEGFYTNNYQRVEKAIHSELAKRIVGKDSLGNFMLKHMGSSELIYNAKKFKKAEDKTNEPFKATITILDLSKDIASVKVTQNKMNFFDYLHLAKISGEWKIINVLWTRTE